MISQFHPHQGELDRTVSYPKVNLDDVLKAFFDLWLFEPGIKAYESRVRQNASFLGIESTAI